MMTALAYGKYAAYVFPAYAITVAALALAVFLVVRAHGRAREKLRRLAADAP